MSCVYECFNFVGITANMYSEMRGEARDHARLRNLYFEQVTSVHFMHDFVSLSLRLSDNIKF